MVLMRNYIRWETGFNKLELLNQLSIEAAKDFQKEFLQHSEYKEDSLLHVLMTQHAHACRITGEIIHHT